MKTTRRIFTALTLGSLLATQAWAQAKVTIYTAAPQDLIDQIIPAFEKSAKVKVELIKGGSGDLINRLKAEKGRQTADVLFSVSTRSGRSEQRSLHQVLTRKREVPGRCVQGQRRSRSLYSRGHVDWCQHQAADAGTISQELDRPGQPHVQGQAVRRTTRQIGLGLLFSWQPSFRSMVKKRVGIFTPKFLTTLCCQTALARFPSL